MNIMLVSVTVRIKETGLRSEFDARAILGVLLAIGTSRLLILLIPSIPATIPTWAVVSGLVVSMGVGLIFGVWPARKASRLDPIECLRYE